MNTQASTSPVFGAAPAGPGRVQQTSSATTATPDALLSQLPLTDGLAASLAQLTSAAAPVLSPVESVVIPLLSPLSTPLATIASPITSLLSQVVDQAAVRSLTSAVSSLAAPLTEAASAPLGAGAAQLSRPLAAMTAPFDADVAQPLSSGLQSFVAPRRPSPGGQLVSPAIAADEPTSPAGSLPDATFTRADNVPAVFGGNGWEWGVVSPASAAQTSPFGSAALPGSGLPRTAATASNTAAGSRSLDDLGVLAPTPTAPPVTPHLPAAAAIGSAATGNSGSGTSGSTGYTDGNWSPQQLRLLGIVDPAGTRSVRNSATKPPVSPG